MTLLQIALSILCGAIGAALGMGIFFWASENIESWRTDRVMRKLQIGKYRANP